MIKTKFLLTVRNKSLIDSTLHILSALSMLNAKNRDQLFILFCALSSISPITAALSAHTVNTIQGTRPYITTDLNRLLSIKIGDDSYTSNEVGQMKDKFDADVTTFTLPDNSFSSVTEIVVANGSDNELSQFIAADACHDDDGDENFTVTGKVIATWTDSSGNVVDPSSTPTAGAEYTLTLKITDPSIETQYGDPRITTYSNLAAVYKFTSASAASTLVDSTTNIYAQANIDHASNVNSSVWESGKGFKSNSNSSKNFPTTGANGFYFDLDISGISNDELVWSPQTVNGITATVSNITATSVRVTLTGSTANKTSAGATAKTFTNPTQIVLQGKKNGSAVVTYAFALTKWFINRGSVTGTPTVQNDWCKGLNSSNYRLTKRTELTNASQTGYTFQRDIDGSLFSEWGYVPTYGWQPTDYWTSDQYYTYNYFVDTNEGYLSYLSPTIPFYGICVSPAN